MSKAFRLSQVRHQEFCHPAVIHVSEEKKITIQHRETNTSNSENQFLSTKTRIDKESIRKDLRCPHSHAAHNKKPKNKCYLRQAGLHARLESHSDLNLAPSLRFIIGG